MKEYLEKETVLKILAKYSTQNGSALGRHSGAVDCAIAEIEQLKPSTERCTCPEERFCEECIAIGTGHDCLPFCDYLSNGPELEDKEENPEGKVRTKGATDFDKLCHKVFDANQQNYLARESGIRCRCGHELKTYYCDERLFVVECDQCETKALVKARSHKEAAYRAFAFEVLPVEEMVWEHEAVFFHHTPIDEPPVYIGSTFSGDFPDDVVCGMYLPCPGTDGTKN